MDELLAFAHARLDEEVQAARACVEEVGGTRAGDPNPDGSGVAERDDYPSYPWGAGEAELAYAARMQPARTLRDVQARRKTLVRCQEEMLSGIPRVVWFARMTAWEMAQRWSDHDDFKESWKP